MAFLVALGLAGCRTTGSTGPGGSELGEGLASYYGAGLQGRPTANGETFDKEKFTAAHRKLPFGTCVRVTFVPTGRSVEVRINDRGPFVANRIIDVSEAAARELGLITLGVGRVKLSRC
jgi:rare lipoprotein A